MDRHADRTQDNKPQSAANALSQTQSEHHSTLDFSDARPQASTQRKLADLANSGPRARQLSALSTIANNSPQARQAAQLQAAADNHSARRLQPIPEKQNNTGLPDDMKSGIENLSGCSMDDGKVHRNSDKPAQLNAHAYAQGTDIHLGSGQEEHLPHEAWDVLQQKQMRVKPTMQLHSAALQRVGREELKARGEYIHKLSEQLPERALNIWKMSSPNGAVIYVLGTEHSLKLSDPRWNKDGRSALIRFLQREAFTHVKTEIAHPELRAARVVPNLAELMEKVADQQEVVNNAQADSREERIARAQLGNKKALTQDYDHKLDEAYLQIARTRDKDGPSVGALETEETRADARLKAVNDLYETNLTELNSESDPENRVISGPETPASDDKLVVHGKQRALFEEQAVDYGKGFDLAAAEERNRQWVETFGQTADPTDKQLWIVGAAHIPGLTVRFQDLEWRTAYGTVA